MKRFLLQSPLWPLACAMLLAGTPPSVAQSLREQEIAQCRPGEMTTWGDGRDRPAAQVPLVFAYSHAAAPSWFTQAQVLSAVQRSAAAWSPCGVPSSVMTQATPGAQIQGAIVVQWNEAGSRGNFGLANLGQRTLSLGPAAFQLLRTRNPGYDAKRTLQMVISHEMGHFYGLMAHSRHCVDVTSYYDNGQGEQCFTRDAAQMKGYVEYRSELPTACDLQRCRMANGVIDVTAPP